MNSLETNTVTKTVKNMQSTIEN